MLNVVNFQIQSAKKSDCDLVTKRNKKNPKKKK